MPGGLLQLVAYGAQDVYLTGNPQITFFKIVYRRYTNFAIETVEHTFTGTIGFGNIHLVILNFKLFYLFRVGKLLMLTLIVKNS